jgi:hypothetical protein
MKRLSRSVFLNELLTGVGEDSSSVSGATGTEKGRNGPWSADATVVVAARAGSSHCPRLGALCYEPSE